MSIYFDRSLYRPKGCGYVLKCTRNDKTYWVHKTYSSLQGLKRALLSRSYEEADVFYVYKIPDDQMIAIAVPYVGDDYWRRDTFTLKELSEFNNDESALYINKARSFYEVVV